MTRAFVSTVHQAIFLRKPINLCLQVSDLPRTDAFMVRHYILMAFCIVFGTFSHSAPAQDARAAPTQISDAGSAYLRAIRLRGIDSDVVYFDPSRPAPSLETRQRVAPDQAASDGQGDWVFAGEGNLLVYVICAVILGGIIYIAIRFGGASAMTFRARTDDSVRGGAKDDSLFGDMMQAEPDLKAILRQSDRKLALGQLMLLALRRAASENDLRLQQSWTVRDALRRLPKTWPHLAALRQVNVAAELARFGGREVSEDDFKAHLETVKPIFGSGAI